MQASTSPVDPIHQPKQKIITSHGFVVVLCSVLYRITEQSGFQSSRYHQHRKTLLWL